MTTEENAMDEFSGGVQTDDATVAVLSLS